MAVQHVVFNILSNRRGSFLFRQSDVACRQSTFRSILLMAQSGGDQDGSGDAPPTRPSDVVAAGIIIQTQTLPTPSTALPEASSGLHTSRLNMGILPPSTPQFDALPRPHSLPQRSTSDVETVRRSPYDPAVRGLAGRSNSASFDPEHVPEDAELLRQRLVAAALSTPVSGDAVSSRLLQALPQLGIGQFLQDFNNQTPPWRGFAAARQDSNDHTAEMDERGRLLAAQPAGEGRVASGSPPRSRRRLSSGASMYSMSASGELESNAPQQAGSTDSTAAAQPSVRVGDATSGRRGSEDETEDQTAMDELQALFRRCHNSLPFVALFLIFFAYQHATGILVFVVGTVAVMGLDQRVREQVALKDKANAWHLVGIVAMCGIDMVAICSVDGQPNPLRHFPHILHSSGAHGSTDGGLLSSGGIFWQVLWTVLVNGTCCVIGVAVCCSPVQL
jgi:hypothetical protein